MMPRRLIRWASRYIGNRGVVLFTFGFMWAIYGLGVFLEPGPASPLGALPEDEFPYWVRGLWWMIPGCVAMGCAVIRKGSDDATAWGLLMLPVFIRWGSFTIAWLMDVSNTGPWQHFPRPWAGWTLFLAFLVVIDRSAAGLDRLPPPARTARKRRKI